MKNFTLKNKDLLKILSAVAPTAERATTVPILMAVKLSLGPNGAAAATTNMEAWAYAQTEECGELTENVWPECGKLLAILQNLPKDEDININLTDTGMLLKASTGRYAFTGMDGGTWPSTTTDDVTCEAKIKAEGLAKALQFTAPCASNDELRYYLNGVHLRLMPAGKIKLTATDGYQLATAIEGADWTNTAAGAEYIIPTSFALNLMVAAGKMSGNAEVILKLSRGKIVAVLNGGNLVLTSRLIDGRFPDTDRLIPHETRETDLVINREATLGAIKRLSYLTEKKDSSIKVVSDGTKTTISLPKTDTMETVQQKEHGGAGLTHVNARKLSNILSLFSGEEVAISLGDGRECLLFTEKSGALNEATARIIILMPVRAE